MPEVTAPTRTVTSDAWLLQRDGYTLDARGPVPVAARRIDRAALADAVTILGLEYPVEVQYSRGHRTAGSYCGLGWKRDGWHVIRVSTAFTAEQMTRTLWHELTHAQQTEGFVRSPDEADYRHLAYKRFQKAYRLFSGTSGGSMRYRTNPYEQAAQDMADRMYLIHPLFTTC